MRSCRTGSGTRPSRKDPSFRLQRRRALSGVGGTLVLPPEWGDLLYGETYDLQQVCEDLLEVPGVVINEKAQREMGVSSPWRA